MLQLRNPGRTMTHIQAAMLMLPKIPDIALWRGSCFAASSTAAIARDAMIRDLGWFGTSARRLGRRRRVVYSAVSREGERRSSQEEESAEGGKQDNAESQSIGWSERRTRSPVLVISSS